MNKIELGNTFVRINDYHMGDCEDLERPFQIYDPIKHKMYTKSIYYDEENACLYIPSGVDMYWVRRCLNEKYYTRLDCSNYKYMDGNVGIKFRPRDDRQQEILRFTCGIGEYEQNQYCPQLILGAGTGVGKSYCSIATIAYFKIRSIVITSSNSLLSQWEDEIVKYTNIDRKEVIRISGSDYCNMILNGSSNKANNGKIYLCSHGTLRSFGDRYGWNKVSELFEYLGIGLKFYDECHVSWDNMTMIDYFTNTYKTYYVSATPARSNYRENKIFQISLKNVPSIELFDEQYNHTAYVAIKWNSQPSASQISYCRHPVYKFDKNKYIDYVTKKPEFYDMLKVIMEMVIKATSNGGRVLMYIGTNDGILRVYHWIMTNYPQFIGDIGVFTSLVDRENKLKEKKKKILLSTTKSAGLGEHIEGLKMSILLAEPFKSQVLAQQSFGRTRDDDTLYIELVDMAFIYCKKFYFEKLPIFNKYATDVSDMLIDNYELQKRVENIDREKNSKYQRCPISFVDERFDFDSVLPQWMKTEEPVPGVPRCPISFVDRDPNKKYYHK